MSKVVYRTAEKQWVEVGGVKNGPYEERYRNGNAYERSNYKDGKLDGHFARWDMDGSVMLSGLYVDGRRHGPWIEWGQAKTYNHGQEVLLATEWDDNFFLNKK